MKTCRLLSAALTAAGVAAAGLTLADGRTPSGFSVGWSVPRDIQAPLPRRAPPPRAVATPVDRNVRGALLHLPDPYPVPSGYWAWDGYRLIWIERLIAPTPFHVPVFDRQGKFRFWEDMSGDISNFNRDVLGVNLRHGND